MFECKTENCKQLELKDNTNFVICIKKPNLP
jgi:hypothetical protein